MIRLCKRAGFVGVIIGVILLFTVKSLAFLPTQELDIKSLDGFVTVDAQNSDDFTENSKRKISKPEIQKYSWGINSFDITGNKEFSRFHFVLSAPGVFSEVRSDVRSAKSIGISLNSFIIRGAKGNFYFSINAVHGFSYVVQGKMENKNIIDNTIQAYINGKDNTLNVVANNFTGKIKVLSKGELLAEKKLTNVNNFICDFLPDKNEIKIDLQKLRCPEICTDVD